MNNESIKTGIKTLLTNNTATLVSGLVFQGDPKGIAQITKSNLTPVLGTYFVLVHIPRSFERSRTGSSNLRSPQRQAIYQVSIEIADNGMVQLLDEQQYETVHANFSILTDRVVDLVKGQQWVTGSPKTELLRTGAENDRRIDKIDLSAPARDASKNLWARLYCQIQFSLLENCA